MALIISSVFAGGCSGGADPAYWLLFDPGETRLSKAEQQQIFSVMAAAFPLADDGAALVDPNCGDIAALAEVTDLNGDGTYEVFIEWGNACLSGHTGRSLMLFVKDATGSYQHQLGFPAAGYQPLERGVDGFPDLLIGGPGFCFPVWSWDGQKYEFKCSQPQVEDGCESRPNICPAQ